MYYEELGVEGVLKVGGCCGFERRQEWEGRGNYYWP